MKKFIALVVCLFAPSLAHAEDISVFGSTCRSVPIEFAAETLSSAEGLVAKIPPLMIVADTSMVCTRPLTDQELLQPLDGNDGIMVCGVLSALPNKLFCVDTGTWKPRTYSISTEAAQTSPRRSRSATPAPRVGTGV